MLDPGRAADSFAGDVEDLVNTIGPDLSAKLQPDEDIKDVVAFLYVNSMARSNRPPSTVSPYTSIPVSSLVLAEASFWCFADPWKPPDVERKLRKIRKRAISGFLSRARLMLLVDPNADLRRLAIIPAATAGYDSFALRDALRQRKISYPDIFPLDRADDL